MRLSPRIALAVTPLMLGAALWSASAAPVAPVGVPRAGCDVFTDAAGDAKLFSAPAPLPQPPNNNDLDLVGVSYWAHDDALSVVLRVADLTGAPQTVFPGEVFSTAFTARGKNVVLTGQRMPHVATPLGSTDGTYDEVMAATYYTYSAWVGALSVDGNTSAAYDAVPVGIQFDTMHDLVTLSVGRSALQKVLGGPLETLSGLSGTTSVGPREFIPFEADSAAAKAGTTVDPDANTCF